MTQIGRLLYVSGFPLDEPSGYAEHVNEIAFHLAELGWEVILVGLVSDLNRIDNKYRCSRKLTIVPIEARKFSDSTLGLTHGVFRLLARHHFDLAYMRPARKTLFVPWLLRKGRISLFVEVNSNTVGEYKSFGKSRLSIFLADLMERFQFRYANGAFAVTKELADYAITRVSNNSNIWVTGNGFRAEATDLAVFDPKPRKALGISEDDIVITFLGRLGVWQGVDLVVEALVDLPNTCLWIIGDGPERQRLAQLSTQLNVNNRVHWFDYREGADLQVLLNATDIGVGTLAMYRKQMREAQSLKVRHYLGVGLPIIIGYEDTRLNESSPGVFYAHTPQQLSARVRQIEQYGNSRKTEYRQQIREFALQNLSWAAIAQQTSEILSEWLASNRTESSRQKDLHVNHDNQGK